MYFGLITKLEIVKKALIGGKLESLKMIIINAYRKLMSNYYIYSQIGDSSIGSKQRVHWLIYIISNILFVM